MDSSSKKSLPAAKANGKARRASAHVDDDFLAGTEPNETPLPPIDRDTREIQSWADWRERRAPALTDSTEPRSDSSPAATPAKIERDPLQDASNVPALFEAMNFSASYDVGDFHDNVLAELHPSSGNRGVVRQSKDKGWLRYETWLVTKKKGIVKAVKRLKVDLVQLYMALNAMPLDELPNPGSLLWHEWRQRLLYKAKLLQIPRTKFRRPTDAMRQLTKGQQYEAVYVLDSIGLLVDLLRSERNPVVCQYTQDERTANLVAVNNEFLMHWNYQMLCLYHPHMALDALALADHVAGIRTSLRQAGMLWMTHDGRYWKFGPAPLGEDDQGGVDAIELLQLLLQPK